MWLFILLTFFVVSIRCHDVALGLSSAVVKTLTRYNLSANATAFMNDYFNIVFFRIYLLDFKTTLVKLF